MKILPLGSSSKGNAYLVEHDGTALLVDCGFSYRELSRRLKEKCGAGADCGIVSAILLTHSHVDHVQGLKTFLKHHDTPVYANLLTSETVIRDQELAEESFLCFENGQCFTIGPFKVCAFPIPHDTSDPVGYLIEAGGETYFHGTDIGRGLESIGRKLAEADIATLESNHDVILLKGSGRAQSLINRITGPRGHLANEEAAALVRDYASPKLKKIFLAHLSQDCNQPHLAERCMRETLTAAGRSDVEVEVLAP